MVEQSKRLLYLLVGLASIFIIINGIRDLAFILNPILLSVVITITLIPLPGWFARRGVPGWLALVLTFLVVLAVIGLILLLIFVGMAQVAELLPSLRASVIADNAGAAVEEQAGALGIRLDELAAAIESFITSQRLTGLATTLLTGLFRGVSQAFLVMLIFAFMLSSALALPSSSRLGLRPDHPMIQRAANLTEDVRRYVTLTTLINFLVAIGNTILLLILGVDLALLWGVLSGFMGYIPAVGFWIAMIPPIILAFVEFGLPTSIVVFVGYVLINGTVENFVKPRMMGQQLRISPVVVVISLFVWGWLLGAVGAILSTPLTLLILSIMEGFDNTRWISILLRTAGIEGDATTSERQEAFGRVRGLRDRVVKAIRGGSLPPPI
jgi:predicted PurR-regulated permease PerM